MKIVVLLFLCFASICCYAQKGPVKKTPNSYPIFETGPANWLDTNNMYNSRYGLVARLTQDNMPCIMPYLQAKPIPNAVEKKEKLNEIPNLWKGQPQPYRSQPRKAIPIPQNLYTPQEYKAPDVWRQEK